MEADILAGLALPRGPVPVGMFLHWNVGDVSQFRGKWVKEKLHLWEEKGWGLGLSKSPPGKREGTSIKENYSVALSCSEKGQDNGNFHHGDNGKPQKHTVLISKGKREVLHAWQNTEKLLWAGQPQHYTHISTNLKRGLEPGSEL